jgi:hypothetical protein
MHIVLAEFILEVSFELAIAKLIALFVLAVVLPCLLYGVIGEVYVGIEEISNVIVLWWRSNVSLVVPEYF